MARFRRRSRGRGKGYGRQQLQWLEESLPSSSTALTESAATATSVLHSAVAMEQFDGDVTVRRIHGSLSARKRTGAASYGVQLKLCVGIRIAAFGDTQSINPSTAQALSWILYLCCIYDFGSSEPLRCTLDSKAMRRIQQPREHDIRLHVGILNIGPVAYVAATHGTLDVSWDTRILVGAS